MTAAIVVIALTAAGLGPALAIDRTQRSASLLGLAFLYGCGVVYLVLLATSVAGVAWSLPLTVAVVLTVSAASWFVGRTDHPMRPPVRVSWIDGVTALLGATFAAAALAHRPPLGDFWAIWGLKGRVFFEARGIDWRFLQSEWNSFAHPDYPLLLPLNYAFTALAGGEWNDRWLGMFSFAFGLALLLVIRGVMAEAFEPVVAATIALAAVAFALSPQIGLAEAPLIAYGTAGLLMLRRALLNDDAGAMRHAALLLGFAGVTKNEGITLFAAAVVAMIICRAPLRRFLPLWAPAMLIGSWTLLRMVYALPSDLTEGDFAGRFLARLGALHLFGREMITSLERPMLWLLLVGACFVVSPRMLGRERLLLIVVAIQLLMFLIVYLGTPYYPQWHITTSWDRLSRQIGAPLLVAVMMALAHTYARAPNDARPR